MESAGPKISLNTVAAAVALILSVGGVVWSAAVQSARIDAVAESDKRQEAKLAEIGRERSGEARELAAIQAKLDILLQERGGRK